MKKGSLEVLFISLLFLVIIGSPVSALSGDEVISRFSSVTNTDIPTNSMYGEIEFPKYYYYCPPVAPVGEVHSLGYSVIGFNGEHCSGTVGIDDSGRRVVVCDGYPCSWGTPYEGSTLYQMRKPGIEISDIYPAQQLNNE